ncbi:hypothetical protein [Ilyomonas limi]|uniref:hypothetical protein n=1 Tax=Ilyomonas limi TaxID=2575867 RepID=UPI001485951F|nr:hypothetical protein [Ilyomonas limi]
MQKVTSTSTNSLEDYPIADWMNELAEGKGIYLTQQKSRKEWKNEYFSAAK